MNVRDDLSRPRDSRDSHARVSIIPSVVKVILGLPRCKNVWYFSLFREARAGVWLLFAGLFCFPCFTSSLSLMQVFTLRMSRTGFYSPASVLLVNSYCVLFSKCDIVILSGALLFAVCRMRRTSFSCVYWTSIDFTIPPRILEQL